MDLNNLLKSSNRIYTGLIGKASLVLIAIGFIGLFIFPRNTQRYRVREIDRIKNCYVDYESAQSIDTSKIFKTDLTQGTIDFIEDTQQSPKSYQDTLINLSEIKSQDLVDECFARTDEFITFEIGDNTYAIHTGILFYHQIINQRVGENLYIVTYSSDGSKNSVVYSVDATFYNSGRIYMGNFLIYDERTESMWDTKSGTAVIGTKTGEQLENIETKIRTFDTLQDKTNIKYLGFPMGNQSNYLSTD